MFLKKVSKKLISFKISVQDPEKKVLSTLELLKLLIKNEGVGTLYRGIIPVLQSLCISNFVYFYTFHTLKALKGNKAGQNAFSDLLLGSLAGIINVLSTTPFWVVNTRLKMKGIKEQSNKQTENYSNLLEGLFYIAKTEGVAKLWAGTMPSLMLVANPALQFMVYEALKRNLAKAYGELPGFYFMVGALSKAFATVVTYPLQLVQTKLRNGKIDNSLPSNAGIIQMLMYLIKTQGVMGLFRGLEAKLWQTVLTAALMFAAYENIAKFVTSLLISQRVK